MDTIQSNDSMEHGEKSEKSLLSLKSESRKSRSESRKSPKRNTERAAETNDISMLQLEMLANRNKIKKEESIQARSVSSDTKKSPSRSREKSPSHKRTKRIRKENKDPQIRSEKNDYILKLSKIGKLYHLSHLSNFNTYDFSLEELEFEYTRVKNELESEKGVQFAKTSVLWSIQALEFLNNKFDPLGADLDGWSEAMSYSITDPEYDQVLGELYDRYKGSMDVHPAVKLSFMLIQSATVFALTKKFKTRMPKEESSDDSEPKMEAPSEKLELEAILKKMEEQKQKPAVKKVGRPKGKKKIVELV
jgi:hypothetical protein